MSRPAWREPIAPYAHPDHRLAARDIATSLVPYLGLLVGVYLLLDVSTLLALALAVPAGGFLVRTFIVFHDCAHGSFFRSKRANERFGRVCAFFVFLPFAKWRHDHAVHHATSGDLDRRGTGDVPTWTVDEYRAKPWRARLGYRLFRNPLVMFTLGPIWSMVVGPRRIARGERKRLRRSVHLTNVALAVSVAGLCWALGWQTYLLIQGPAALIAGAAGVWLFYVQHQFEDAYWESGEAWSYADAALRGSSYLKLPAVLRFFTGNIGLHHVHHLSASVPNYHLLRAHRETDLFGEVPVLTLADGLRATRLKLWDPDRGRMIGWAELRGEPVAAAPAAP